MQQEGVDISQDSLTIRSRQVALSGLTANTNRVKKLIINRVGLTQFPAWLADLPALTNLSILENPISNLAGLLPVNLSSLTLESCGLREFPSDLPENLRALDLSKNIIDDPTGFEGLTATLRTLILTDNRISILPKRFPLRILTKLVLDTNELTALPSSLPNTLRHLSVCGNRLTELPSRLPIDLRVLSLANNQISEICLKTLAKCIELTRLDLSRNRIETLEAGFLPPRLQILDLSENGLWLQDSLVVPSTIRLIDFHTNKIDDISHLKFSRIAPTLPVIALRRTFFTDARRFGNWRLPRRQGHDLSIDEAEELEGNGVTLNLSDNQLLTYIPEGCLPSNLVQLRLDHCGLRELPLDLHTKPIELLSVTNNYLSVLHVSRLPSSLVNVNLSQNLIGTIHERSGSTAVVSHLNSLNLSYNQISAIPPGWLREIGATLQILHLQNNIMEQFPSPLFEGLIMITLNSNLLRGLGTVRLPSSLQRLDLASNMIVSLLGPPLLGLTRHMTDLTLFGNTLRYVSPEIRLHLEQIFREEPDAEWAGGGRRARNQIFDILPIGTVYADSQIVHRHAVQESVRESICNLLKDGILDQAPDIDTVANEIVKTTICHHSLRDMFMHSGIIETTTMPTRSSDELIALLVPVDQRDPTQNLSPQEITLGDPPTIAFADVLRMSWHIIRHHPEREAMIGNIDQELGRSDAPCITGLVSALIGCLAGFGGTAAKIVIKISVAEQLAAIIEASGRMIEKRGVYSVEEHRTLARAEMIERGFSTGEIESWIVHIGEE